MTNRRVGPGDVRLLCEPMKPTVFTVCAEPGSLRSASLSLVQSKFQLVDLNLPDCHRLRVHNGPMKSMAQSTKASEELNESTRNIPK